MTFEKKKAEFISALQKKGFFVESDKNSISFSLTSIGLSSVWAVIDREEIEYALENE